MGKSTLMNHLIGQKIAITSNKPQTTRNRIQTVYTGPKGQIVFLDTPGIHKAKNKLGNYMVKVAESTFSDVDVILWLVEPTTYIGAGERHILEQLKRSRLPVILVINKIDTVPKTAVLDAMETYRKEMDFAEIVPVSALRSNNTDTLLDCIFKYLPYGEPFYDEDTITDQPQRQIVAEMIREKALRCLEEEIPHGIAVAVERMEFKEHIVNIDATIIAQAPKMRPHIDQMRQNMADALKIDVSQINVKATTEEGLGFTGAGEGISAQAICLLNSPMGLYDQNVTSGCGGCGGCGVQ